MNMYYDQPGYMHSYYSSMFGGFFDVLWHVAVIVLLIMLIVRLVRGPRRHWGNWGGRHNRMYSMWHANSAVSLLDERYAKGEIEKEEYEERKKTLLG